MAKQSGIHQLRGKVGEHSYYRQSGVAAGLVRSINQGMSQRVKTDEAYANVRLNNAEFGNGCDIAGQLGRIVVPKFRPMVINFSQSRMSKAVLALIKEGTEPWGQRGLNTGNVANLNDILSDTAKYPFANFINSYSVARGANNLTVTFGFAPGFENLMDAIGCDSITISVTAVQFLAGKYNDSISKYQKSYSRALGSGDFTYNSTETEGEETLNILPPVMPASGSYVSTIMLVFVIMPIRTINSAPYIMQEYCTFKSIEVPAA